MKYKKPSFWIITVSVIALIIFGVCFLTNPLTQDKEDNNVYIDYTSTVQSNVPDEVVNFAKKYIQEYIIYSSKSWKEIGDKNDLPHITDAKIIALTQIDTKTEKTNSGEQLWKLEYRLKVDGNIDSIIIGGMSEKDGWLTEWSSSGQPYLIVHWEDVNGQTKWELVDVVGDEDIINYNTPQMLQKYGDKYTATVREKYISNQNSLDYKKSNIGTVLYDNDKFGGEASGVTTDFTATNGSGNIISIWYDNQESSSVKITLYKYGLFGSKDIVFEFEVAGNDSQRKEYTEYSADSGKYYINVSSSYGGDIMGHLQVNQIYS